MRDKCLGYLQVIGLLIVLLLLLPFYLQIAFCQSDTGAEKKAILTTGFLYKKPLAGNKYIYLTFDDGPNPYVTPQVLDILDQYKIKAAFFLIGSNIKKYPAIVKEINKRGHIIGNHAFSHPLSFFLYSTKAQQEQVRKNDELLTSLGISPTKYFRPPGTTYNKRMSAALPDYTLVGVNHYVADHYIFSPQTIAARVIHSIEKKGGGIVVLHDGAIMPFARSRKILAEALKILIPQLLAKGYKFGSLSELTDSNAIVYTSQNN